MRVRLYTETGSVHELDAKAMTYIRLHQGHASGELRRDGETIPMVFFSIPELGDRALITLRVREDGGLTTRSTSPVVRIEESGGGYGASPQS